MHMGSVHETIQQRLNQGKSGQCDCGASCECFACAQHPNNRTTLDYIRYHNELLMRAAQSQAALHYGAAPSQSPGFPYQFASGQPQPQSSPRLPIQTGYGTSFVFSQAQPPGFQPNFGWMPHSPVQTMDSMTFPNTVALGANSIISSQPPFTVPIQPERQSRRASVPTTRSDHTQSKISAPPTTLPFDPESPADDDASTLSPSSFLLSQYTVPGCDDITGTMSS